MQIPTWEVQANLMLARYYSSSLGRFMAVDPGDDTHPEDPQSWNKYAYVRNNPIKLLDNNGKWSMSGVDPIGAVGHLVAGVVLKAVAPVNGLIQGTKAAAAAAVDSLKVTVTAKLGSVGVSGSVDMNGKVDVGGGGEKPLGKGAGAPSVGVEGGTGGINVSGSVPIGEGAVGTADTEGNVGVGVGAKVGKIGEVSVVPTTNAPSIGEAFEKGYEQGAAETNQKADEELHKAGQAAGVAP